MKMKRFLSGALACVLSVGLLWMAPSMEALAGGGTFSGVVCRLNSKDCGTCSVTVSGYTPVSGSIYVTTVDELSFAIFAISLTVDGSVPNGTPVSAIFSGWDGFYGDVDFEGKGSEHLYIEFDMPFPSGEKEHHHSRPKTDASSDYSYHEVNGELVYGGLFNGVMAKSTIVPASAYPVFNDFAVKKLQKGETNEDGKLVIQCSVWKSLPEKVMKAMQETSKDVEIIYTASDDQTYVIEVPSGLDVMQYVDENGYCGLEYLGSKLGQSLYVK